MDWSSLIGPAVIAAVVSALVSLVGTWVNRITTLYTHREKLKSEKKLAKRRFKFDRHLAGLKFDHDRKLSERKTVLELEAQNARRKQELAEELLTGFYEAEVIMRSVRAPFGHQGEGKTRPREEGETETERTRRDTRYVPIERFEKGRESIARLNSKEYRAVAWFGAEIRQSFEELNSAIRKVFAANQMLLEDNYDQTEEGRRLFKELMSTVYSVSLDGDPIEDEIKGAVRRVEAICRPVLVGSDALARSEIG